ncbi:hypothetical protein [Nocardia sp. JMUB6875]|uniref:hypothetical protein n=1 Tax=Nocardia sp. JMUB6875 TaxID=3158170 RepID=UPI0034E8FDE1
MVNQLVAVDRSEQVLQIEDGLRLSAVTYRAPVPQGRWPHPPEFDQLRHLRIKPVDSPDDPASADAIIVMLPGAIAGARSMQPVGCNTVRRLLAAGVRAEFWSLDRRPNALEDHSPIPVALAEGDHRLAFDYYYRGREVGGRRFPGFRRNRDLRFLADFGMAQVVADTHAVVSAEIPDPDVRGGKLFLGGHSLGGFQAGTYAGWDFAGRPGHEQVAGLIALDTVTNLDVFRLRSQRPRLGAAASSASRLVDTLVPKAIRRGLIPGSVAVRPVRVPEMFAMLAAVATAAVLAPHAESDVLSLIPERGTAALAVRAAASRTWRQFAGLGPDHRKLRLTNRAALGLIASAHTAPTLGVLSMNCGSLDGPVAPCTWPLPEGAAGRPVLGALRQAGMGVTPRHAPTSRDHLYTWRNFDQCDSTAGEFADITELARILAGGELNVFEDYFAVRETLDVAPAALGCRTGSLAPLRHEPGAAKLPYINLMGEASFTDVIRFLDVYPKDAHWIPGYLHCDVALSSDRRPDGVPEPVAVHLSEFVGKQVRRAPGRAS